MTKREAIAILTKHFLTEDKDTLANALAITMVDIHDLVDIETMSRAQFERFTKKLMAIDREILDIVNGGKYAGIRIVDTDTWHVNDASSTPRVN